MLNLSIPEHIEPLRNKVLKFIEERIYPVEKELFETDRDGRRDTMQKLMKEAKAQGLWALGHPEEIGGGGLPFMDYVFINEVVGPLGRGDGGARHALAAGLDHAAPLRERRMARQVPEAARRRRSVPELRHDRTGRCEFRPDATADARRTDRRRMGDQRPQMVHVRRGAGGVHDRHVPHRNRRARSRGVQPDRRADRARRATTSCATWR